MKTKCFSVCILLMAVAISYFLLNTFFHKNSNDSIIYLGIKDKNTWADDVKSQLFRVPFKWEAGKWTAMPNYYSARNVESKSPSSLSEEYPNALTFPPAIIAKKIKDDLYAECGSYELPSGYTLSIPVISTNPGVVPKKVIYGTPSEEEKQKIAPLLKTKVPAYTRADENGNPAGKVELRLKDFVFKSIKINGHTLIRASLNRDLYPLVFSEGHPDPNEEEFNPTGEFISYWYIMREGIPVFFGAGLEFLECADYANNNTSQFIFRISGYNRDGYRLFYNDFKNKVDFTWSYH